MKKAFASIIVALLMLVPAVVSAQDVPDLSKDWKLVDEDTATFYAAMPDGTPLSINARAKSFINEGKGLGASVLVWSNDVEVAMLFQNDDNAKTAWMAIKVGGKWYRAKEPGSVLRAGVITDKDNKPIRVRLIMDTVDGPKVLDLPL